MYKNSHQLLKASNDMTSTDITYTNYQTIPTVRTQSNRSDTKCNDPIFRTSISKILSEKMNSFLKNNNNISRTLRQNYNMDALIFSLLNQLPSMQKELFVMIMWSLWKRRNLKLWQHQNETCM